MNKSIHLNRNGFAWCNVISETPILTEDVSKVTCKRCMPEIIQKFPKNSYTYIELQLAIENAFRMGMEWADYEIIKKLQDDND